MGSGCLVTGPSPAGVYTLSLHDALPISGKAPAGVARAAAAKGIPCVAVSGRCQLSSVDLAAAGFSAAYALTDLEPDRKSTRLNSSHMSISYAVFCLKKKNITQPGRSDEH